MNNYSMRPYLISKHFDAKLAILAATSIIRLCSQAALSSRSMIDNSVYCR